MAILPLKVECEPLLVDLYTVRPTGGPGEYLGLLSQEKSHIAYEVSGGWDTMVVTRARSDLVRMRPQLEGVMYRAGFPLLAFESVCSVQEFWHWAWTKPIMVVSAVRVNCLFAALGGWEGVAAASRYIVEHVNRLCEGSSRCLFTLGSNQIMLFIFPRKFRMALEAVAQIARINAADVAELWRVVKDVRADRLSEQLEACASKLGGPVEKQPLALLSKTKTWLAWRPQDEWKKPWMEGVPEGGPVLATVAVDAAPARETSVQRNWREHFPSALGFPLDLEHPGREDALTTADSLPAYGVDDLRAPLLRCPDLSSFIERLQRFRGSVLRTTGRFTTTSAFLLPGNEYPDLESVRLDDKAIRESLQRSLDMLEEPATDGGPSGAQPNSVQRREMSVLLHRELTDLIIAANGSVGDAEVGADFSDLSDGLLALEPSIQQQLQRACPSRVELLELRRFINLLTQALYERDRGLWQDGAAPGLQFHSHACGTHAVLRAHELLAGTILGLLAENWRWPGFVMSTTEAGMYDAPGGIMMIPLRTLFRPIPNLVRLGHECAHALFDRVAANLTIPSLGPAEAWADGLADVRSGATLCGYPDRIALQMMSEAFAHLFDYHFFLKDLDDCVAAAWGSWLETQLAWRSPDAPHVRTAILCAAEMLDQPDTRNGLGASADAYGDIAKKASDEATRRIKDLRISDALKEQCLAAEQNSIDRLAVLYLPALRFFAEQTLLWQDVRGLRSCSEEESRLLEQQAAAIMAGHVITDPIPNPIELPFRLRQHSQHETNTHWQAQMATVLTLCHVYDVNSDLPATVRRW